MTPPGSIDDSGYHVLGYYLVSQGLCIWLQRYDLPSYLWRLEGTQWDS